MFVHLWDVHYDFIPPSPYDTMFDPDYSGSVTGENFFFDRSINPDMPRRDLEHLVALYDGEIAWTDEYLGRIIARLETLGVLDDTIIAVTSDHGTAFFEHGLKGHRNSLFDELIHVPLVIRYPAAIEAGTRVATQTRSIDIGPTLLDLAGLATPGDVHGHSLLPLVWDDPLDRYSEAVSELFSVGQRVRTLRTSRWKFYDVMNSDLRLWTDLVADPGERALRPATVGQGTALESRYDQAVAGLVPVEVMAGAVADPLPEAVRRQLKSLGYVGED
jgi:arylsulfatase A-like enzyme